MLLFLQLSVPVMAVVAVVEIDIQIHYQQQLAAQVEQEEVVVVALVVQQVMEAPEVILVVVVAAVVATVIMGIHQMQEVAVPDLMDLLQLAIHQTLLHQPSPHPHHSLQ